MFRLIASLAALAVWLLSRTELRTSAGRDFQAAQMSGTAGATATWIGLTTVTTAEVSTDTTLAGEITTGALSRHQATYSHTTGQATYTLVFTYTSDQSATVAKIGVFTASSAGTMVFETSLNASATLVSGDQLQVTETVNL